METLQMLLLLCLVTVYHSSAIKFHKRDVEDLKEDALLASVFAYDSDPSAKRPDRSISPQEELAAQLDNGASKKRHAGPEPDPDPVPVASAMPSDELMALSSKSNPMQANFVRTPDSVDKLKKIMSSKMSLTDKGALLGKLLEDKKDSVPDKNNSSESDLMRSFLVHPQPAPAPVEDIPVPQVAQANIIPQPMLPFAPAPSPLDAQVSASPMDYGSQNSAVDPSQVASMFPSQQAVNAPWQGDQVAEAIDQVKRSQIPQAPRSSDMGTTSFFAPDMVKKSVIPHSMEDTIQIQTGPVAFHSSTPVTLRRHSENMKVGGIVPHFAEYGETVESVEKAMAVQAKYNAEIVKKSGIPQPPFKVPKPINGKSSKKSQQAPVLQEVYQGFNPALGYNAITTSGLTATQYGAAYDVATPATTEDASHVKAMDLAPIQHAKPIPGSENHPCADQYTSCDGFAKNNYCTNYPEQMRLQCRKSCGYCVPPLTSPVVATTGGVAPGVVGVDGVAGVSTVSGVPVAGISPAVAMASAVSPITSNTALPLTLVVATPVNSAGMVPAAAALGPHAAAISATAANVKPLLRLAAPVHAVNTHRSTLEDISGSGSGSGASENEPSQDVPVVSATSRSTVTAASGSGMPDEQGSGSGFGADSEDNSASKKSEIIKPNVPTLNTIARKPDESSKRATIAYADSTGSGSGEANGESSGESEAPVPMPVSAVASKTAAASGSGAGVNASEGEKKVPVVHKVQKAKQIVKSALFPASKKKNKKKKIEKHAKKESKKHTKNETKKKLIQNVEEKNLKMATKKDTVSKKEDKTEKKEKKSDIPKPKLDQLQKIAQQEIKKSVIPGPYPKIDLREIANALAHYEQAAIELAGEYPKPAQADYTEVARSTIPQPSVQDKSKYEKYQQNMQIASLLTSKGDKRFEIPKYLKMGEDIHEEGGKAKVKDEADSLNSVVKRFEIPGVVPNLNDYYAETGKLNPFSESSIVKRNRIEKAAIRKSFEDPNIDPYEYLRNMPAGASMEPITDPKSRSKIPMDTSYPVFLMKVSPAEHKYSFEAPAKRGTIRKLDAEGLPITKQARKPFADPQPASLTAPQPPPQIPQQTFPVAPRAQFQQQMPPQFEQLQIPQVPSTQFGPSPPVYNTMFAAPPDFSAQPQAQYQPQQEQQQYQQMNQQMNQERVQQAAAQYGRMPGYEQSPQDTASFIMQQPQFNSPPSLSHEPAVEMRSKMLSAFFGKSPDLGKSEEIGSGEGSGESVQRGAIEHVKSSSFPNLLATNNLKKSSSINVDTNIIPDKVDNMLLGPSPVDSQSYLQSNLAALTPDYSPNYEMQSSISGRMGSQFQMSKTQETNWVRPNAQSELAAFMPTKAENNSPMDGAQEAASFQAPKYYPGASMMASSNVAISPLSLTTIESQAKHEVFKKNLIKQKPDLSCGEGWEGASGDFGTFCYKQMNMKASFDDALAECRRLKSDMFSILNAYENRYLEENVHEKIWIGYRDKGMNGNWNWTDSSRGIYTNWQTESDDDNGQRHDCVYINGKSGEWRDEACGEKKKYLCKQKSDECPGSWQNLKLNSVTGCYKLMNDSLSWTDAEQSCEDSGAHLTSIASEDEQTMVFQVHSSKNFWIGLNDRESEGDWQWADRTTSSYTNWADKSPNNGGVSCAAMLEGGKWHDEPCNEKLKFICKKKGPRGENLQGLDDQNNLLPLARLQSNADTSPSLIYDELSKGGPRPVVPIYFWPMLKNSKTGLAGNRPIASHGNVKTVPGGIALDGLRSFLDGGDFHGKCVCDPDKCVKGFAVAIQIFLEESVRVHNKPRQIIDTSGGDRGFTIFVQNNKLHYKVISKDAVWLLQTDLTTNRWQDIVMTWHKFKGISVYVNGAFKDNAAIGARREDTSSTGTARLIIGRESKTKGPYTYTRMIIASVSIFTKVLTVEDVPYAFTFDDTAVATYRWLLPKAEQNIVPGAPEIEVRKQIGDVDGGLFIDGDKGWLEIDDFDSCLVDVSSCKHGFSLSFKVKFDQRVRDYKEPRYVLDTGGHNSGVKGVSVYLVNDNLYFQVIASPQEDTLIWKVRTPIYTVRWQRIVVTWRLDEGLWVYLDGSFRGVTKVPSSIPAINKESSKRFLIGRKSKGPNYAGAQFGFGSLAMYTRYLNRKDADKVFGGGDDPFPGIIREVWKDTPGESIQSLTQNPDYPNNPTTIEIIENFDAPFNVDKDYGSKLKGYFIAPETGKCVFYLSCSKSCELYFSADEDAKNKTNIISLQKPTWHNQWNKYENQSSLEIELVAGKYYYLEAVHKGVENSDSLSVGVRMPTGRYQRPINKENLQWRLPGNPYAGIIREVWYEVPGYQIGDLTSNLNFPNKPSSVEVLDKFDAPFNVDDNYGSRLSGYFRAPETGDYRFYLATDDTGELWLSSDDSESNLVKLVTLNGWTDHNQWLKYPEQKSDKVFLVGGRYYFIRVYMKADKLGDCASVAVELPSGHFEGPIKKKHLLWKLPGSKANEGPGPKDLQEQIPKPIGLFSLNDVSLKESMINAGDDKMVVSNVDLSSGPGGVKDASFAFKGKNDSYIEIPNRNGHLDARNSITMLANVFPVGEDGPIVNYRRNGWGVHMWQFEKNQLFVRFVSRDGKMNTQPLGSRVLELNTWNQIGASYDNNTGVAQLWHDGKMVKSRHIGQINLMTNSPIRVGAREGDDRYFKGKISCIQIYDRSLVESQIGDLRHCPKKPVSHNKELDTIVSMTGSGAGSGEQSLEDAYSMENRVGEETEEELIETRCEPNPCANDGKCRTDDVKVDGFMCECTPHFTGRHCQVSKKKAVNPLVKRIPFKRTKFEKKITVENYQVEDVSKRSSLKGNTSNKHIGEEKKEDVSLLFQNMGCYKDDPHTRDLPDKVSTNKQTQEDCVKACALQDKSFSYFGVQNGGDCYCGKKYGKYGKLDESNCALSCKENSKEKCGGEASNNVFFFGLGTNYTVRTFTGSRFGAGTDAKIYVEFIGERGNSDFRQLDHSLDKYESGSIDTESFIMPDLGKIKGVKVLHDNSGTAPSWFLKKIDVLGEDGDKYEFPCNDWLSDSRSGGKLERDLSARTLIIKKKDT